jgi:phenylacetate-CoA ligase
MKHDNLPMDSVRRKLAQYRLNQQLDRSALERDQLARFRALAAHAYRHSLFYRRIIDERGIHPGTCTPQDFPVLTKALVIEHFDEIVTDRTLDKTCVQRFLRAAIEPTELVHGKYVVRETSGTSGERLIVVSSLDECASFAAQMKRFEPVEPGRTKIAFVGVTNRYAASYIGVSHLFSSQADSEFLPIDVGMPLADMVQQLNDFRPDVLCGYTSAILALARAQTGERLRCRPASISCVGEVMLAPVSAEIQRAFGCPVMNVYGTTEFGVMGIGQGEQMMLLDDDLIYEFNDDHVNVTSLNQRTMPFIRYTLHDALKRRDGCSVGPYPLICPHFGRTEDAIRLLNDAGRMDELNALALIGWSLRIDGLSQFQVVVEGVRSICLRFSLAGTLPESHKRIARAKVHEALKAMLTLKGMAQVSVRLEESAVSFADPVTGKTRLVCYPPDARTGNEMQEAIAECVG